MHLQSPKGTASGFLTFLYLLCDFEDPEQPQRAEDGEAEAARQRHHVGPHHLEHGGHDHDAVEPVERRLEVDPGAEGVHAHDHLRDEQTQEHELGVVCNNKSGNSLVDATLAI